MKEPILTEIIEKYQRGKISLEIAAKMAKLNQRDFLKVLASKKINVFVIDWDDLDRELERASEQ
jgi:predicted HTH domain antitoxin